MTLFERVFNGNDAVYGLTEQAIDAAIDVFNEDFASITGEGKTMANC